MENENIILNFDNKKEYNITDNNETNNINFTENEFVFVARKGQRLKAKEIKNAIVTIPRGTLGVNEWQFEFYSDDNILLGTLKDNGTSVYIKGNILNEEEYIKIKTVILIGSNNLVNNDTIELQFKFSTGDMTNYSDSDLNNPDDNYNFTDFAFALDSIHTTSLALYNGSNYISWQFNSVGSSISYTGAINGTLNNIQSALIQFAGIGAYNTFATINDGLYEIKLTKNSNDDKLGGSILLFYNKTAWEYAFKNNGVRNIYITKDGSIWSGDNSTQNNLVVNGKGEIGVAGGNIFKKIYMENTINSYFYPNIFGDTFYNKELDYFSGYTSRNGSSEKPFYSISDGITGIGSKNKIAILDDSYYFENIELNNINLYSKTNPTINFNIGTNNKYNANVFNNTNTNFVSLKGNDITGNGTYENPYFSLDYTINSGGKSNIIIITSGTYLLSTNINIIGKNIRALNCDVTITNKDNINSYFIVSNNSQFYNLKFVLNNYNPVQIINPVVSTSTTILFCEFIGGQTAVGYQLGNTALLRIYNCIFSGQETAISHGFTSADIIIKNCYIYDCTDIGIDVHDSATAFPRIIIENNIIDNCTNYGVKISSLSTIFTFSLKNNTILYCDINLSLNIYTVTISNNICYFATTLDIQTTGGSSNSETFNNNCYNLISINGSTNNNPIVANPKLYNYSEKKYFLDFNSPCLNTGLSNYNVGAYTPTIFILSNNLEINGIILINNFLYNILIHKDIDNTLINNINILESIAGIYFNNSNTALKNMDINNSTFKNNDISILNNQNININNSIFINCDYGIINNNEMTIKNCDFIYNSYGIYLFTFSQITNSIFYKNTYDIFSEVILSLLYDCIINVNGNIDITSNTNIKQDPLFINSVTEPYDFHLKSIEGGYKFDSPCINAGNDNKDMGAYDTTRALQNNYWEVLELANPKKINFGIKIIQNKLQRDITGNLHKRNIDTKRTVTLNYNSNQIGNEKVLKTFEYLLSNLDNNTIRFFYLYNQFLNSGSGTILNNKITDNTKDWVFNEFKGFYTSFELESLSGNISSNTITDSSKSWTTNEWIGYYVRYNNTYYTIISNTATVLTISDPNSSIPAVTGITLSIFDYAKITSNDKTNLYFENNINIKANGNYKIDFFEGIITNNDIKYSQARYYYQKETWKTGYKITIEEI